MTAATQGPAQVSCREPQCEKLRALLSGVLESDVGQQVLLRLADGQGTDTADGRAWLAAAQELSGARRC